MSILQYGIGVTQAYYTEHQRIVLDQYEDTMHLMNESELVPSFWPTERSTACGTRGLETQFILLNSIQMAQFPEYHNACRTCCGILVFQQMQKG